MKETDLLDQLIAATHLPEDLVRSEIFRLCKKANLDPKNLNLENIRKILGLYLLDIVWETSN